MGRVSVNATVAGVGPTLMGCARDYVDRYLWADVFRYDPIGEVPAYRNFQSERQKDRGLERYFNGD